MLPQLFIFSIHVCQCLGQGDVVRDAHPLSAAARRDASPALLSAPLIWLLQTLPWAPGCCAGGFFPSLVMLSQPRFPPFRVA